MGRGLGGGDNPTPFDHASYGDSNAVDAYEGERRRSIGYRGKLEAGMFIAGAGMGLVVVGAIIVRIALALR
jgi:hypothetical protein